MTTRLVASLLRNALTRLVPASHREALAGDLEEEYTARARCTSPAAALCWYAREVAASAPHLAWSSLRSAEWPATLGVALLAYVAVGIAQALIQWALPVAPAGASPIVALALTWPLVLLIAFCAERRRARAAPALAAIMLLAMLAMVLLTRESVPPLHWAAWFIAGPSAALLGKQLAARRAGARQGGRP